MTQKLILTKELIFISREIECSYRIRQFFTSDAKYHWNINIFYVTSHL